MCSNASFGITYFVWWICEDAFGIMLWVFGTFVCVRDFQGTKNAKRSVWADPTPVTGGAHIQYRASRCVTGFDIALSISKSDKKRKQSPAAVRLPKYDILC